MSGRVLLGVLAGLLLPMPLVVLLGSVMFPAPSPPVPEKVRVSPVLDVEEATRRLTYHRKCRRNSDCEPPLGCFFDVRAGTTYCTDSRCQTDAQCAEDERCLQLATEGEGPQVRLCVPVGLRQEGEECVPLPRDKGAACGVGLVCGGHEGWCGRPCLPGDAASCPEGFFCADVRPEPVCFPTCEARGCPEGQQCIRREEGASACEVVYGPNCKQSPCPEGRKCELETEPRRPGKVWMACVIRCGKNGPACPAGLTCDGFECLPSCDPNGPNTCAEGYRCRQRFSTRPWTCLPDWPEL